MSDAYWRYNDGRQQQPAASSLVAKRPRTDYDAQSGRDMASYYPRDDERLTQRTIRDTESINQSYDRYLRSGQLYPGADAGRLPGSGVSNHAVDDPRMGSDPRIPGDPRMVNDPRMINDPRMSNDPRMTSVGIMDPGMSGKGRGSHLGSGRSEVSLPPDASSTLFVEGLPANCTRREVAHIFRPFVGYKEVRLVTKEARHSGGDPLVLCFVDFLSPAHAATAMDALQGRKGVQVANLVPAIFPPLFCVEKKRKCQMHIGDATMEDNNSLPSLHSSANALPPIMAFVTTYNPTMSMSGSMYENARSPAPWKWRKVAYGGMQPGFDDNHTDDSFLKDMVTNANVVKRDLWKVILDSVSITQYLCTVALVVLVWTYTLASSISLKTLLLLDVTLLVSGFIVMFLTASMISLKLLAKYMLNILYFIIGLYALSPIYHTLTRSISSDSIWALTTMLIVLHLFLHDYTGCTVKAPGSVANPTLSSNISLNTSIIASVLIASRLPSRELVFAVVLFSLQVFLFAPFIVYCMKRCSTLLYLCFSLGLMGLTLALLYRLQGLLFGMLLGLLVFVNFVCPYWLTRIQKYKFEINGPWDEAKLCFDITE